MAIDDRANGAQAQEDTMYLGRPAAQYLDEATVELAGIKQRLHATLAVRPGQRVLDVGCGTGVDVLEISAQVGPAGQAIGVDLGADVVAEARRRAASGRHPADFMVAEASSLPFADEYFDACRAERVLQHVPDPGLVVAEMTRVTRPGGRLQFADPDHQAWSVETDQEALSGRVLEWWFGNIRNPWIGQRLADLVGAADVQDVQAEVLPVRLCGLAAAEGLIGLLRALKYATMEGVLTAAEASAWRDELRWRDAEGRFRLHGAVVAVHGIRSPR